MTHEGIEQRVSQLIAKYDYPVEILEDVYKRLKDSPCVHYHMQQLRYLNNLVKYGLVDRRK